MALPQLFIDAVPDCQIPLCQAAKLDPETQATLYKRCIQAVVIPTPSYLMWECLAAHHSHPDAQEKLAGVSGHVRARERSRRKPTPIRWS